MFDAVTAASPWEVPAAKRTRMIGGAFALHFLAIASYMVLSVWAIRPVAPPDLLDAFVWNPPAPEVVVTFQPAPKEMSRGSAGPATNPNPQPVSAPTQPTAVGELDPAPLAPIEMTTGPGIVGAVGEGDGPASIGETAGTAAGSGEVSIPYFSGMTAPKILNRVEPLYPEIARRLHKQGVVVIEAEIGRDGLVRSARAVSALGFGFEEAALAALPTWVFQPATLHGRPQAVFYRLSVAFKLQ